MRAFRAFAVLGMAVSGWIGWRAAMIGNDVGPPPPAAAFDSFAPEPPPMAEDGFSWRDPPPAPVYAEPAPLYAQAPPRVVYAPAQPAAYATWPEDPPVRRLRRRPRENWGSDLFASRDDGAYSFLTGYDASRRDAAPDAPRAAPPPPITSPAMLEQGWREAGEAYAKLQSGDRAGAAEAFRLALSLAPDHPNARIWASERRRLVKRFRVEAYILTRELSDAALPAASPVLGAGSTSVFLAFSPRPTARRPVEFFARAVAGDPANTIDGLAGFQGAAGVSWRPFPKVPFTLSAERLFAIKQPARDDFQFRASGGYGGRWAGLLLDSFAEGGLVGDRPDWFFGGQAAAIKPVRLTGQLNAGIGGGVWGSYQSTPGLNLSRIDVGPTLRIRRSNFPVTFSADYRFRIQGNAFPGDGPAVTLNANF